MGIFARSALTTGSLGRIAEAAATAYLERTLGGTALPVGRKDRMSGQRGDLRHRVGGQIYYYSVKVNGARISAAERRRDLAWNLQSGGNAVRYIVLDIHPTSGKVLGIATSGDWS